MWSSPYDGFIPDPDASFQEMAKENSIKPDFSEFRHQRRQRLALGSFTSLGERMLTELEWDDSYDTGISPGSDASSSQPSNDTGSTSLASPIEPPKHIQEMKKNAIMLIKGSYIEESDFQDDVMVYRLCALKDAQDSAKPKDETDNSTAETQNQIPAPTTKNGPVPHAQADNDLAERNRKNNSLNHEETKDQKSHDSSTMDTSSDFSPTPSLEADVNSNMKTLVRTLSPESEDFIARCDEIMEGLGTSTVILEQQKSTSPEPVSAMEEDEDDFESFSPETPSMESIPSPFGQKDQATFANPARFQGAPFTGERFCFFHFF